MPKQDREELLSRIPVDASRVQVLTKTGRLRFKAKQNILSTDEIQVKDNGDPVVMMGEPGRRAKPDLRGKNEEIDQTIENKKEYIKFDRIVRAVRGELPAEDVLQNLLIEVSELQASMGFFQEELEREGKFSDTATVYAKRIQVLKMFSDTLFKRMDRQRSQTLDTESTAFQVYFNHVLITFKNAMVEAKMRPEMIETIFSSYAKKMGDPAWESEVRAKIKSAV